MADADEFCARGTVDRQDNVDHFRDFCRAGGSDPELEKRMVDAIVSAGAERRHFSLRCRADACKVKCVTSPREACVDELRRVTTWAARHQRFDAVAHSSRRGYAAYKFPSNEYLAAMPARREVLARIARRLHDSPAMAQCKQNATTHGLLLLYIDVPVNGSPTVTVGGDVAWTADADCVSKALLATVLDEQVQPPFANRAIPIAMKL